jgi:inhibitor of cysteine peptidase
VQITEAQNGQTVRLALNDTADVTLAENPSTGYTWALQASVGPTLEMIGTNYVPDSPGTVGGGGKRTWTFKAVQPGTKAVLLTNNAPSGLPMKDFSVNIQV